MRSLNSVDGKNFTVDVELPQGVDSLYVDELIRQINSGIYEPLFKDRRGLTFLDIGANIGLVSIYASTVCHKIHAIEPAPNIRKVLEELTIPFPNIERYYVALSDHDGAQTFYINDINFTASSTVNTYGITTTVPCRTLSSILKDLELTKVDVCKIDCEGAEGEALNLSELEYAKDIISTYYIETHNCPKTTWEHKLGTLVGNLARCGYSEMTISGMAITAIRP